MLGRITGSEHHVTERAGELTESFAGNHRGLTSLLISSPEMPWPARDELIDATIATAFHAGAASRPRS